MTRLTSLVCALSLLACGGGADPTDSGTDAARDASGSTTSIPQSLATTWPRWTTTSAARWRRAGSRPAGPATSIVWSSTQVTSPT